MGIVYKARDPVIGRLVALKTLTAEVLSDPELLKRFYREAQSAGGLQHPNIVTIYDMGESGGRPFIAMEYVEGESLQKVIARREAFPLALKLKIISQFCQGLDHAHKRGVIHRDVKPGNILVKSDGAVKVVDFGIAHLDSTTLTKTGVFMGTLNYSSPEQLNDGRVDVRSDLWSVAVVMYEFLTYHKPFEGPNFSSLISKILNADPEPISRHYPGVPPAIDALVSRCLDKDPAKRPPGLDEVLLELAPIEAESRRGVVAELVTEAQELRLKGDLTRAQEKMRSVLMLDSTHHEARSLMSQITEEVRRIESSSRLIQLGNDAEKRLAQGELTEALASIEEALKISPPDPRVLSLQSRALEEQRRQKAAQDAFAKGHSAFKQGDLTGAESALQAALGLDPRNPRAKSLMEIIHEDRATRARSFDLKEAVWDAENRLAEGDTEGAADRLAKLAAAHPSNQEVKDLLAKAQQMRIARPSEHNREWLDSQLSAAMLLAEANDFDQATRVVSGVKKEYPSDPRVQQLYERVQSRAQSREPASAAAPPLPAGIAERAQSAVPKNRTTLVIVVAAVVVLALVAAFVIHDLGHHQTAIATATPQQLKIEKQAKQLVAQGQPDQALSLWSILAAQPGPLQAEAERQVEQIAANSQQEKTLYAQAQAAQDKKNWNQALSLYQQVGNLNGSLKNQALQAIASVKALQSGEDPAVIERQKYTEAQAALRRHDDARARDFLQQVVSLNVPHSTLLAQARSALARLNAEVQEQQDFNSAVSMENGGQLTQAAAKFQQIAGTGGALAAQARSRVQQIDQQLSAQQKKQVTAQALQGNVGKFKAFETEGQFSQARALLASVRQEGGDSAELSSELDEVEQTKLQKLVDEFTQAQAAKNTTELQALATQFEALASQGGSVASSAREYATRLVPGAISQLAAANRTALVKPAALVAAPAARAAQVSLVPSGSYRPYNGPIGRNQLLPDYNVDGGLKPVSLSLPPIQGAPAGSLVIIKINIDPNGGVTPDIIVNDTSGVGAAVLSDASHWKFQPPRVRSKPVRTSVSVMVKF